jgi:hypothetical protein
VIEFRPLVLLSATVLLLGSACDASPAADDRAADSDAKNTNGANEVFPGGTVREVGVVLVRQGGRPFDGSEETPQARIIGKLVVGEGNCLRLEGGPAEHLPIWPPGYSLNARGGEMRILDDKGQVVARVGDRVIAVGGETTEGGGGPSYWEKRRKLGVPPGCDGPLWGMVPPIREIGHGRPGTS